MFKKGDYVVNSNNGICKIEDIIMMDSSNGKKEYYLLIPISEQTAKVYIPVDRADQRIRLAMNKEQALQFIHAIKDIKETYVENEKEREKTYKEAVNSREPRRMVGIIKTLYLRRLERAGAGKKTTTIDERYFKLAENYLHSELAFALQVGKEEINQIILKNIEGY